MKKKNTKTGETEAMKLEREFYGLFRCEDSESSHEEYDICVAKLKKLVGEEEFEKIYNHSLKQMSRYE